MTPFEFSELVAEHFGLYSAILAASSLAYFICYRRFFPGTAWIIFDPFLIYVVGIVFATASVVLMYETGYTSNRDMGDYGLTEVAFYVGFALCGPRRSAVEYALEKNTDLKLSHEQKLTERIALYLLSVGIVVCTIAFIAQYGFFRTEDASRLDVYQVQGAGALDKLASALVIAAFLMILRAWFSHQLDRNDKILLVGPTMVALLIYQLSSGAKSSILQLFSIFFAAYFYFGLPQRTLARKGNAARRKQNLALGVVIAICVAGYAFGLFRGTNLQGELLFLKLAGRFILSGDIFVYAYPIHWLDQHTSDDGLLAVFATPIGSAHLVPWDQLPPQMGYVVQKEIANIDYFGGPNPRHNFFGIYYFGRFGGFLYSLIVGAIAGGARRLIGSIRAKDCGFLEYILVVMLYLATCSVGTDISGFWNGIIRLVLIIPFYFAATGLTHLICAAVLRRRET